MVQEISIRIGQNIRKHRNIKQLSQEALAERADLTANYLGQIERGEKKSNDLYIRKSNKWSGYVIIRSNTGI